MNTDHAHLLRVAQRATEHGDRRTVKALLTQYHAEVESLRRHPGSSAKTMAERNDRLAVVKRSVQRLGSMLAGDRGDACAEAGASPWAEAQKSRQWRDPLCFMKLTAAQINAAEEIRTIFEATVRALMLGNVDLAAIRVDTSIKNRDPWLNLSPWVAKRRVDVYLPWVHHFGRKRPVRERAGERLGVVYLVLAVLVDHESFRALAKVWHIRERTLSRDFRWALDGYNEIGRKARRERELVEGTS